MASIPAMIANRVTSRVTGQWAAARAGSMRVAGQDFVGGGADFAASFMNRASGANASTGGPSVAGAAGDLTGLAANGALKNGAQYATNMNANRTANGGGSAMPFSPDSAMGKSLSNFD